MLVDIGLYLGEHIRSVLDIVAVVLELIGHQVVAHVVASYDHGTLPVGGQVIGVDTADGVLHVAVVTHVSAVEEQPVALVVLVEAV